MDPKGKYLIFMTTANGIKNNRNTVTVQRTKTLTHTEQQHFLLEIRNVRLIWLH